MRKVVLMIDKVGNVVDVVDNMTGSSMPFDVHPMQPASTELDPRVSVACMPSAFEHSLQRALNSAMANGSPAECIPLPHCSHERGRVRGCVHLMHNDSEPTSSGWPLDLRYATGITIVELERRLFNGTYLSADFFRSPEFKARRDAVLAEMSVPKGAPPGLINVGQRALTCFKEITSDAFVSDPLLRTYRAKYMDTWTPHMEGAKPARMQNYASGGRRATAPRTPRKL